MGPTKRWVLWMTNKERVRSRHAVHETYYKKKVGVKEMGSYLQKPVSHQGFDNVFKKTFQRTDIASLKGGSFVSTFQLFLKLALNSF